MSFRIAAPNPNLYSPPMPRMPSIMGVENVTVNYDSEGLFNGLGVIPFSQYNIASQSLPVDITFTGLKVKYSTESGNEYTGGSLNRFIVTLYKNRAPTSLTVNVDNINSEETVDVITWNRVSLLRSDKWAVYISPSPNAGEAPTSGQGVWKIYLTY